MKKPRKIVLGTFETRSFNFTAFGPSKEAVIETLSCTWIRHCMDVQDQTGFECDLSLFTPDSVRIEEMVEGRGYEDGKQIYPKPSTPETK